MITTYNVVSEDGYISRIDHSEDFIPDEAWPRFLDLCREYGVVAMGRKTYETIQGYEPHLRNSFNALPVSKIVLSRDEKFTAIEGAGYEVAHSTDEACKLFLKHELDAAKGVLVTSGPTLNTSLLRDGLIDMMIVDKLPVRLGEGLKIFEEGAEPEMELVSKKELGEGAERCLYSIGGKDEGGK